jgi:hypothetical protein
VKGLPALLSICVAGCAQRAPALAPPPAAPPPRISAVASERAELREEMRALGRQHCGCHQASLPQAKPAALAVFDLDQPRWSAALSAGQLQGFLQRLEGELDAPARPRLRAFIDGELALRSAR